MMSHASACTCMGIFTVFFSSVSMNYMLALGIEVALKLKRQIQAHYRIRKILYHVLCIGFALFLVVLALVRGDYGYSSMKTCSVIGGSATYNIRLASFAGIIVSIWLLAPWIMGKVGKTYSNVIFNYFLVVVFMTLTVTSTNILNSIEYFGVERREIYSEIALVVGCSTGIWMGIARLWNKRLIRQVLWKVGIKHRRTGYLRASGGFRHSDSLLNENIYNFGDLFENISKKSALRILTVVSLRFGNCDEKFFSIENEVDYDQYEFDQEVFEGLGDAYDMERLNESNCYAVYSPDLYLLEYQPKVFQEIRNMCNISRNDLLE